MSTHTRELFAFTLQVNKRESCIVRDSLMYINYRKISDGVIVCADTTSLGYEFLLRMLETLTAFSGIDLCSFGRRKQRFISNATHDDWNISFYSHSRICFQMLSYAFSFLLWHMCFNTCPELRNTNSGKIVIVWETSNFYSPRSLVETIVKILTLRFCTNFLSRETFYPRIRVCFFLSTITR